MVHCSFGYYHCAPAHARMHAGHVTAHRRLWGAQTQRSLQNFKIGDPLVERMPEELIRALGSVKRAAALVRPCI